MEPEGSLPYSQDSSTGPYNEAELYPVKFGPLKRISTSCHLHPRGLLPLPVNTWSICLPIRRRSAIFI